MIQTEKLRATSVSDIEKFEYDNQDRMVKRIRLVDENALDGDSLSAAVAFRDGTVPDKIRIVTSYAYDVLGNRTK